MDEDDETKQEIETRKRQELEERKDKEAFIWLMADVRGRRIVYRLLEMAGVFKISYTGNADTNFNEGQRNQGLKLMALCEGFAPGHVLKMLKENRLKEKESNG